MKVIILCYIPTIFIAMSDTLKKMDRGEDIWWEVLTLKLFNYVNTILDSTDDGRASSMGEDKSGANRKH